MWDLNRAERKALATALVLVGVSLIVRTVLAPDPGDVGGIGAVDPGRDLDAVTGEVLSGLERERRAQTPLAEGERIEVNRAPADELRRLPRVGPSLAQAIVEAREQAPFRDADDLERVAGVGEVTARRLAPYLSFDAPAPGPGAVASTSPVAPARPAAERIAHPAGAGCPAGGGLVDLNRAGPAELESLPGIGAVIAGRIIEDRNANGPFPGTQALTRVRGIGERSFSRLADRICAGRP